MSGLGMIITLLFLKPQETNQTYKTTYGIIFIFSFISSILLILISLLGKRIIYNGIKWHSLNYSLFNIIIILVRINNSNRSPWVKFMTSNLDKDLQDRIFCTCYGIYYFGSTFYLISVVLWYYIPNIEKKIWYKICLWPITIFSIDILGILSFFLNDWLVDSEDNYTYELAPLSMYHGISIVVYSICMIIFFLFSLTLFLIEIAKLCNNQLSKLEADKNNFQSFKIPIDILLINFWSIISYIIIYPGNSIIFGIFVADNWGEHFFKYRAFLTNSLKITKQYDDLFMVIAPIVQFLLTVIFFKEFRESFFWIITCGKLYNYDLTEDSNRWAKEVKNKNLFLTNKNNT